MTHLLLLVAAPLVLRTHPIVVLASTAAASLLFGFILGVLFSFFLLSLFILTDPKGDCGKNLSPQIFGLGHFFQRLPRQTWRPVSDRSFSCVTRQIQTSLLKRLVGINRDNAGWLTARVRAQAARTTTWKAGARRRRRRRWQRVAGQ